MPTKIPRSLVGHLILTARRHSFSPSGVPEQAADRAGTSRAHLDVPWQVSMSLGNTRQDRHRARGRHCAIPGPQRRTKTLTITKLTAVGRTGNQSPFQTSPSDIECVSVLTRYTCAPTLSAPSPTSAYIHLAPDINETCSQIPMAANAAGWPLHLPRMR